MTTLGIIVMAVSVGGSTCFLAWCIWRVMSTSKSSESLHMTYEHDTPDTHEDDE